MIKIISNILLNNKLQHKIKVNITPLGRWNIENNNKKLNIKIDLSNEDHCGPCGQYILEKYNFKNKINFINENNENIDKNNNKIINDNKIINENKIINDNKIIDENNKIIDENNEIIDKYNKKKINNIIQNEQYISLFRI